MKITVRLSEKELEEAAMEYVSARSKPGSLQFVPTSVSFSTIARDHSQGTETTAQVSCETRDHKTPFEAVKS